MLSSHNTHRHVPRRFQHNPRHTSCSPTPTSSIGVHTHCLQNNTHTHAHKSHNSMTATRACPENLSAPGEVAGVPSPGPPLSPVSMHCSRALNTGWPAYICGHTNSCKGKPCMKRTRRIMNVPILPILSPSQDDPHPKIIPTLRCPRASKTWAYGNLSVLLTPSALHLDAVWCPSICCTCEELENLPQSNSPSHIQQMDADTGKQAGYEKIPT